MSPTLPLPPELEPVGTNPPIEAATGASGADIVHDFTALLRNILGEVSKLEGEASLSPDGRAGLEQIRHAASRASDLTRRLGSLSALRPSAPRISGPQATRPSTPFTGTETILLVDDDDNVRQLARRVLEQQGYTVLDASNAVSAIMLADGHHGPVHLLLAAAALPGSSGRALAARIAVHRPTTKILYVSESNDGVIMRHRVLDPGTECLVKPFSLDHLLRAVRQTLDGKS